MRIKRDYFKFDKNSVVVVTTAKLDNALIK